ncbi:molybdopterin molybdotransferase MoeA [Rhizomicrobium electricum]|jgi:molybdopterin molybdotransferase|uniref:Molybdopterin molybdenumtransferase n=1 Tax=Rhizomicrobium electricum TaxID=480070 RepID=A0ABP3PS15_9PROT|nr:molybdopterin molybdotransferase MoeA [Rhizomicrobium electricum]NIJ48924.1 molybdopterin molybdotransferase [Rhizomicrobium electricum]
MITVEEAQARVVATFKPIDTELEDLTHLSGRTAAEDIRAAADNPPMPISTVDGYAVRRADGETTRKIVGRAAPGHPYRGSVGNGEAVRIVIGGVLPEGADAIVFHEEASDESGDLHFSNAAVHPEHIRPAGLDFKAGSVLVPAGKRITARDMALLAAGGVAQAKVRRRPRVAIASVGDELSAPGDQRRPGDIYAATGYGLSAMIASWGGAPCDFGILEDNAQEIATIADADADLVVALGGNSVGNTDLIARALGSTDFSMETWKVAYRPGRPLLFGQLGGTPMLGFPGNPASALVCALLFIRPSLDVMLGTQQSTCSLPQRFKCGCHAMSARLTTELPATDERKTYVRARLAMQGGEVWAEPYPVLEYPMLSVLAKADALVVLPPNAPAAKAGDMVEIIPLDGY